MSFCLNNLKAEGETMAALKGYKGVLDMALAHSRMDEKTLEAMWTAIREALPELREYFKAKGRLLGHENGLPFYDLFAPVGQSTRTYTVEEARALLLDLFGKFCPEMGEMMRTAFDEGWIDMYPREGKSGRRILFRLLRQEHQPRDGQLCGQRLRRQHAGAMSRVTPSTTACCITSRS